MENDAPTWPRRTSLKTRSGPRKPYISRDFSFPDLWGSISHGCPADCRPASLGAASYSLGFRSRLRRLTMSEAVRFKSSERELFEGLYADHNTWWVLGSIRNTVPLPDPNEEAGAETLGSGLFADEGGLGVSSSLGDLLTGSGLPCSSASLSSKVGPMRSVNTASALFGSVTTSKTRSCVSRFARYWSRPRAIGIRYTVWTLERSWPANSAPVSDSRRKARLISSMISAAQRSNSPAAVR